MLKAFIKRQISGDWGKEVVDDLYNTEVFCIRGADINSVNEGNYKNLPIRFIKPENKSKFLREGNIIIEVSGGSPTQSTGRVSYVRGIYPNIICSNFCRAYEITENHSSKYFYYLIKNIYNSNIFFNFESKTTGIKNLLLDVAFENIKVKRVPLSIQTSIAKFLTNIDAKIELNNRINAQLEAMAKTLYDYWFVQFDFPDANGKPYKTSGGKMVWNEELKREIPEGWSSILIESLLFKEPSIKKIPSSEILESGFIPVIDQSSGFIAGFTNDKTTAIETKLPRIIFGDHTRIIKLINFSFARGADGTQILLSNSERMPQHLFYQTLLKIDLSNYGYARHFKFLKGTRIVLPNTEIAQKYEGIIKSYYSMIKANIFQNQTLAELRDWLLPMLMNGQVMVK